MDLLFDKECIWHPYTSLSESPTVYPVVRTEGCEIILEDGTRLIDGMASWWSAIHGYNHPELNEAIINQTKSFAHVMFGGFTHEPAIQLAKKLVEITPEGLENVFFSDSGSVAVEVAIKMAVQYWQALGKTSKKKMITIKGGYHGDTFGAMSVCDPETGMHHLFHGSVQEQIFSERPRCKFRDEWSDEYIHDLEVKIKANYEQLAGLILEPIAQCAGGMWFYSPRFLKEVKKLCEKYDVLLIADEVATGFGRTGKMFACEWAGVTPDIMCVGKGLTGGYMTLAATLTTKKVAEGIAKNGGVFMHGPTFMANPLACSVANKSIELLQKMDWQTKIQEIEETLKQGLNQLKVHPRVKDVRVLGAIGVVEMLDSVDVEAFQKKCVEFGVWIRPFGHFIYVMPAYVISEKQLGTLIKVIVSLI